MKKVVSSAISFKSDVKVFYVRFDPGEKSQNVGMMNNL